MSRWLHLSWIVALCTLLAACQSRDWAFVRSVGGLSVGLPYEHAEGWFLPVDVDVSGLRAITEKPVMMNSGLACRAVSAVRQGREIRLTLVTAPAGAGTNAACAPVSLGRLQAGIYAVYYKSPDGSLVHLRDITIEPSLSG